MVANSYIWIFAVYRIGSRLIKWIKSPSRVTVSSSSQFSLCIILEDLKVEGRILLRLSHNRLQRYCHRGIISLWTEIKRSCSTVFSHLFMIKGRWRETEHTSSYWCSQITEAISKALSLNRATVWVWLDPRSKKSIIRTHILHNINYSPICKTIWYIQHKPVTEA